MIKRIISYLSFQVNFPVLKVENGSHLDLGSGRNVRNPFGVSNLYGVDIATPTQNLNEATKFISTDITQNLPFPDSTFDSISAFDVLEHIPRWERDSNNQIVFPFVNLMSEIFRILKPGGLFVSVTPAYPAPEAFQDPTHINVITENTVEYFVGSNPAAKTVGYGFTGNFSIAHHSWLRGGGPFESLDNRISPGLSGRGPVKDLMKFIKRSIRLLNSRKRSHLLWVLRAEK